MFKSLFIVGIGRSGTSLIQSILDSHSEIRFFKENQFLRFVLYDKKMNINQFIKSKYERIEELELEISKNYNKYAGKNFYDLMKLRLARITTKKIKFIGDKDPRLIDFLLPLKQDFPLNKIIVMKRNPGDIILSRTKAKWSKKWPFLFHLILVKGQINFSRKSIRKIDAGSIIEVSYENLIKSPEITVKEVVNYLDLDFENSMLDYINSSKRLTSSDELDWKKNIFKKIDASNIGKWIIEFSESKRFLIYKTFKEYYNDEKLYFKLNFFQIIILNIISSAVNLLSKLYFLRLRI